MTGDCINGCLPGKIGSNCSKDCEEGSYGENCNMRCGNCFDETPCDVITGSCTLVGCADFFQGLTCHQRIPPSSSPVIYIVISIFCGVLGTAAAFLTYYFYKKSRQMNKQNGEVVLHCVDGDKDINPTSSTTNDAVTTGYGDITSNTHNVDYENQLFDTGDNTRNVLVH
ncbi:hypothetical protein SNE40_012405 [Patella caerulea]|uniref:EGF-like domain-containing protein n=1 Tax=Patella caerulea TaxID=87958 RepID=A0AAN8JRJ2_PATCE